MSLSTATTSRTTLEHAGTVGSSSQQQPQQPPTKPHVSRNKSSSTLASKRNKSSASLSGGGHGHHGVQFVHHGHGKKRRQSTEGGMKRKGAFDFGFTAVDSQGAHPDSDEDDEALDTADHEHDEEEDGAQRPKYKRRSSSSSSTGKRKGATKPSFKPSAEEPTIVEGSLVNSNSEWESANEASPLVKDKTALPSSFVDVPSGLRNTVMTAPSEAEEPSQPSSPTPIPAAEPPAPLPASPPRLSRQPSQRAKFHIAEDSPDSPAGGPSLAAVDKILQAEERQQRQREQEQQEQRAQEEEKADTFKEPPTLSVPQVETVTATSVETSGTTPRALGPRKASNASLSSMRSMRSSSSFRDLMGPQNPALRRTVSGLAPTLSLDAIGGEVGDERTPLSSLRPHNRTDSMSSLRSIRSMVEAPPGRSGQSSPGSALPTDARATAGRMDAAGKLRALRSSTSSDASPAVAALGMAGGQDAKGYLNAQKRSASGYFSSLRGFTTSMISASPTPETKQATYPYPGMRSGLGPSKHRPLVSKFIEEPRTPAVTPPVPLSSSPTTITNMPQGDGESAAAAHARRISAGGDLGGSIGRSQSTASLSGSGLMSRTAQKALLARDAPYYPGSGATEGRGLDGPNALTASFYAQAPALPLPPAPAQVHPAPALLQETDSGASTARSQTPSSMYQQSRASSVTQDYAASRNGSSPSSSALLNSEVSNSRHAGMQRWVMGLLQETGRIEREYKAVDRWRDPFAESLARVAAKKAAGTHAATHSGRRHHHHHSHHASSATASSGGSSR